MNRILGLVVAASLLVAGYGAWAEDLALASLGLIAAVCCAVVFGLDSARRQRQSDVFGGLGNEERALLRPIRKLDEDLEALAAKPGSEAVRIVAQEAIDESRRITEQAIKMVAVRTEIKKAIAEDPGEHLGQMRKSIQQIDGTLTQAEKTLGELKAKLLAASVSPSKAEEGADDIRASMERLQALSVSFDEAEQLLGNQR